MNRTEHIMGMPITVICPDTTAGLSVLDDVFAFFRRIDDAYSPYKPTSEVARINRGELDEADYSPELQSILAIARTTTEQTGGYFNVRHKDVFDPSGIVKGWAIHEAAMIMAKATSDYYLEAGGDIEVSGHSSTGQPWRVGVRNPFNRQENIAVIQLDHGGIATSGTAIRGPHIYNPLDEQADLSDVISVSVIAPSIVDADRMATAAFAMGRAGITFIESLPGFEGYLVTNTKQVIQTTGWHDFEVQS